MPSQSDITVKKNDGSTDITYTKVQASGGDKSPAIWRSNSVGSANAFRPELRIISVANGGNSARRVDLQFTYPVTAEGADGKTYVTDRFNFAGSGIVPQAMTDTDVAEAVSQAMNLAASSHVKDQFKAGYAAT